MLRVSSVRACVAAGKATGEVAAPPAPAAAAAGASSRRQSKPHSSFHPLPFHAWQRSAAAALWSSHPGGARPVVELPEGVSFHGPTLGPRPIVVLGAALPSLEGAAAQAESFSHSLSQAAWEHGAIHVPIVATSATASPTLIRDVANQVVKLLDVLGVGWTHTLSHGLGALVASKMALDHPTRAGTLMVMDSSIVSKAWIENSKAREEIEKALDDVNVPASALDFRVEQLRAALEAPLAASDSNDVALFKDVLFSPEYLFGSSQGLKRKDASYLSIDELRILRHPLQLIVPAANGVCDVNTHKDFFNLRRVQPIKSCKSHAELFQPSTGSNGAAEEVGSMIDQWVQRYEPDVMLSRRCETALKDMRARMAPAGGAAPSAAADGDAAAGGKKKSEKKDKKSEKKGPPA